MTSIVRCVLVVVIAAPGCGKPASDSAQGADKAVSGDRAPAIELPPAPPLEWWKAGESACPPGTSLVGEVGDVRCEKESGQRHGPSAEWRRDVVELGSYVNDDKHGLWHWYRDDRKVRAGGYVRGKAHGTFRQWDSAGKELGSYTMAHGTGTLMSWREDGQLYEKDDYRDGVPHGNQLSWHPDGSPAAEGKWERFKRVGDWTEWYPGGPVWQKYSFVADKMHGVYTMWHANGAKSEEGEYDHGDRVGRWSFWDAQGAVIRTEEWSAGELVSTNSAPPPTGGSATVAPTPDECGGYTVDVALPEQHACKADSDCAVTEHRPGDCIKPLCSGHYRAGTHGWVKAVDELHARVCTGKKYNICIRVKCLLAKPTGARCEAGKCELVVKY